MTEKNDRPEEQPQSDERKGTDRRKFIKVAGAAAGAAAMTASNTASADNFEDTADRYIPPGQSWHHTGLEWYEFPSDNPKVIEVFGYADKLSYLPGEDVSLHMTTGAKTFDIEIYRDGGKMELVHEAKGVAGKRSTTPKDCYTVGCGWPALYKWQLPRDLRSGFYLVVFSVMRGEERIEQEAGFVVRSAKPKWRSP